MVNNIDHIIHTKSEKNRDDNQETGCAGDYILEGKKTYSTGMRSVEAALHLCGNSLCLDAQLASHVLVTDIITIIKELRLNRLHKANNHLKD